MDAKEHARDQLDGRAGAFREFSVELLRELRPVAVPLFILGATMLALLAGTGLPDSLAGLKSAGPYVLLLLATALSAWFNRGRPFIAAVSLLGAYFAYDTALGYGPEGFAARAVFAAISLLVPLNLALAVTLGHQGFFHRQNTRWLLVAAGEILLVAWIASAGRSDFSGSAWAELFEHWLFRSPPTPVAARAMMVMAFTILLMRAWPKPPARAPLPLDMGLVSVLVTFFIACEWATSPGAFSAFIAASGMMLLMALMQESHRLAFRDELTGLPGRRSLEEKLRGLGERCAVAVVDVDHFKLFNDTHGHDIGDQVLKLVAARLAEVGGGGTAYRYGGEEFVVLFPDRGPDDAQPHLERIRASIESYRMAVRAPDRPKLEAADKNRAARLRQDRAPDKTLSVTVSIGLAGCGDARETPAQAMKAADEALYRAKNSGRNKLSR